MSLAKTALFVRRSVGGLFAVEDQLTGTGDRIFVHSGTGTDAAGYGTGPDKPTATIDYGIGLATASEQSQVIVMPGHAESITGASSIACDVIGVSIIGLGEGNLIPTVTASAAAGACTISVANVTIKNIRFVAGFETGVTQTIAIAAGGDGCTLDGVQIRDTTATMEYKSHINVATTVLDLTIKNCSIVGIIAGTLASSILFAGTTSDVVIEDNYIFCDSSDSVIDHSAGKATNVRLSRNIIINEDTTTAKYCIEMEATSTGVAHDNRMGYNKVDAEVTTGDAMWWLENYASNTIAESGILEPPNVPHAIP